MYKLFLYFIAVIVAACNATQSQEADPVPVTTIKTTFSKDSAAIFHKTDTGTDKKFSLDVGEEMGEETVPYYIIIADTSADYHLLREKMFALNSSLGISIDTMRRTYNPSKNLIALPEDDEDEIFAGDYFPRRFPSNNLSLEYLNFYQENALEKTIALVAGIYETKSSADSALTTIKPQNKNAFALKANIYVGCLH